MTDVWYDPKYALLAVPSFSSPGTAGREVG
jgi:hypothetical protein